MHGAKSSQEISSLVNHLRLYLVWNVSPGAPSHVDDPQKKSRVVVPAARTISRRAEMTPDVVGRYGIGAAVLALRARFEAPVLCSQLAWQVTSTAPRERGHRRLAICLDLDML
jgi:hypothetical protein